MNAPATPAARFQNPSDITIAIPRRSDYKPRRQRQPPPTMTKLIVNPNTPDTWEIELREGVTRIGRGPGNDVTLEHASVSSEHCEVQVAEGSATLRDLGSLGGSFVNGQLVEEAALISGQRLKLGEVELEFVGETARAEVAPAAEPASPTLPPAGRAGRCRHHPKETARWRCSKCGHTFCDLCVSTRSAGGAFCRTCARACESYLAPLEPAAMTGTFSSSLGEAFAYPFRGDGPVLLAVGTLFLVLLHYAYFFARFAFLFGTAAVLIMAVLGLGFFFNYAKQVIAATAANEHALPDWPEISDLTDDILRPCGQCLALVVLSFGPVVLLQFWQLAIGPLALWDWEPPPSVLWAALNWSALGVGALLVPMGMLALAIFDTVGALNPVVLIRSIGRAPVPYFISASVFELVVGTELVLGRMLPALLPVPILPTVAAEFLSLYLLTVGMRILGNFYRFHRTELGWF